MGNIAQGNCLNGQIWGEGKGRDQEEIKLVLNLGLLHSLISSLSAQLQKAIMEMMDASSPDMPGLLNIGHTQKLTSKNYF